jgi:hypothetical protein
MTGNTAMAKVFKFNMARRTLSVAWLLNAALLVVAFVWIYLSGDSLARMSALGTRLGLIDDTTTDVSSWYQSDVTTAVSIAAVVACTLLAMFCGLFIGERRYRSTRAWLAFMALVCGWLGFLVTWPDVYWLGQQRRMAAVLQPVERLAQELSQNWPTEDGNHSGIGPYLAYPQGAPTTLLPLRSVTLPDTALGFSSIERTEDGVIRFELAGDEVGAWLERRSDDRLPQPFKSGLYVDYNVAREARLAPRWFLVRYEPVALGGGYRFVAPKHIH